LESVGRQDSGGELNADGAVAAMNGEFYLAWAHGRLDAARAIPPDSLLLISATCLILLLISYVGWVKASNRLRALAHEKIALEGEIATARRALDTERKWRLVAEKSVADATKPEIGVEPLPPHALQALLEREMANPVQPQVADEDAAEEITPSVELEEPPPVAEPWPPAPLPTAEKEPEPAAPALVEKRPAPAPPAGAKKEPAPAPAPVENRPAPAKTKSARRTAKVAGLINRTIFE
jgi:hypothetical protein